jgi:2-alkenal reductase
VGTALRIVLVTVASAAAAAVLFAAGTAGGVLLGMLPAEAVTRPTQPFAPSDPFDGNTIAAVAEAGLPPAAQVYEQAAASVVNVTSLAIVRTGQGQAVQPRGIGSGFVLDAQGHIVTNDHVIQDAQQLAVTFYDQTTVPARLVGRDPDNDLAIIQVDPGATDEEGHALAGVLRPATLGDSDRVTIGETVVAIGSPLGLQQTVTQGILSARRDPGEPPLDLLGGALQTDAAINPGNSGGPVFNARGEVIGVARAILSQSGGNEGIGLAIPINVVKRVAPELIQTGWYRHPLLGVAGLPLAQLSPATKQQLGIPTNLRGLLVQEVSGGAEQAGIRAASRSVTLGGEHSTTSGDIIVAIDGHPVATGGELRGYIEYHTHPGDAVTVTVWRGGQRHELVITLTERPAMRPGE